MACKYIIQVYKTFLLLQIIVIEIVAHTSAAKPIENLDTVKIMKHGREEVDL